MKVSNITFTATGKSKAWKESVATLWNAGGEDLLRLLVKGIKNPIVSILLNSVISMLESLIESWEEEDPEK